MASGELGLDHLDDLVGATPGLSMQMAIASRPAGAGGAEHVEPRAVAVVDLEAETRRGPDHLGVGVDDRHVDAAGEERLARHLAEAAETDDQRLAR